MLILDPSGKVASTIGLAMLTGFLILSDIRMKENIQETSPSLAALAAGRRKGRAKMRTAADLDTALVAIGSPPAGVTDPVSDHQSDALLTAAWLRAVADDARLWRPEALTPRLAETEGWTFGIA